MPQSNTEWRRSTYSVQGNCVEVAILDGSVSVRDSKDSNGPQLHFTGAQWTSLIDAVRAGRLRRTTDGSTP